MAEKKQLGSSLETVASGFANGISTHLAKKQSIEGEHAKLTQDEKQQIIDEAAYYFGRFLLALGVDWENDPNSNDTPRRVAKAYATRNGFVVNEKDVLREVSKASASLKLTLGGSAEAVAVVIGSEITKT